MFSVSPSGGTGCQVSSLLMVICDHVVKALAAQFLHGTVTVFLFVTGKMISGDTLRLCKYSVSYHSAHLLNLAPVGDAHLQRLRTAVLATW